MYRGKMFSRYCSKNRIRSFNGLSYNVVENLIQPFLLQEYSLYINNFYTSPEFVLDFYKECIHVTGILDCGRIGIPSQDPEKCFAKGGRQCVCYRWDLRICSVKGYQICVSSVQSVSRLFRNKCYKKCEESIWYNNKARCPYSSNIVQLQHLYVRS